MDNLLSLYHRELKYLRSLGAEFAEVHPGAAAHLRMTGEAIEDPHVSRLIESIAFLNARIRQKIEDEFPELTDALLGQLFPHYLAPIPSMAIVQFKPAKDLASRYRVESGTRFETEPVRGDRCRYRTTQDLTLWPVEIESASLSGLPLKGPPSPRTAGAVSVLRISLSCLDNAATFTKLSPASLRFFIRGAPAETFALYELIFNNAILVALADSVTDPKAILLDATEIGACGFGDDEGMLPYQPRSPLGYRLLTEFFVLPEKFLFFEIPLQAKLAAGAGRKLDIYIYLNRNLPGLERAVSAQSFALGCVPAVNLFRQTVAPFRLEETQSEYHLLPDETRRNALEVYSVDKVEAHSTKEKVTYAPFFGLKHAGTSRSGTRFWHAARRPAGERDPGFETYLTLVDLDGDPSVPAERVAHVETTCLDRDRPGLLPFGPGRPALGLVDKVAVVESLTCVTPPTKTLRLPSRNEGAWRLISHLTLGHLSLADTANGAEALREILRLYDFRDTPETRALIDSVLNVGTARTVARAPDPAMGALCRGLDVTVTFKDLRESGAGIFLFAAVLERFIAHYASINAFTRLTATLEGRGVFKKWPPRAGDLQLL